MPLRVADDRWAPYLEYRTLEPDWDAYAEMSADAEVMRYIGTGVMLTREESWRSIANFLGHWRLRGYGMWALESKETGEFLGRAGFHEPPGWPGFELGWVLGRRIGGAVTQARRRARRWLMPSTSSDGRR